METRTEKIVKWFRSKLNHYLSPLHMYCRMIDLGMEKSKARRWATTYENVYRVVFA